jgi:predicted PurR-regulated permease PerM
MPVSRRPYATGFFLVVLFGVGALSFIILRPFFEALAWAIVLAVAFRKPWLRFVSRFPKSPNFAAAVASSTIGLGVLVPAALLGAVLVAQAADAVATLAERVRSQNVSSLSDLAALPAVAGLLERVQAWVGLSPEELQGRAGEIAGSLSTFLAARSGGLALSILDALLTFVTAIFLLFFLFRDGENVSRDLVELIPLPAGESQKLVGRFLSMIQQLFRGSLLCALVQGTTGGLGWGLAGLPSPVLAGALMAVLSLLPVGGTAIVWAPGAVVLWFQGRHGAAIFLAAWGAIVASFLADNVLKPILLRGGGELNTLLVFLGVFGGISAFGLLGVFLGPLTLALGITLVDALRMRARLEAEDGVRS